MSSTEHPLIELINKKDGLGMGITSSPSTTLEIVIDITEDGRHERILGQMVYVVLEDDGGKILVIGQIVSIQTRNRWHEDMSFKGVIKHHGKLPHLSERADNRIAEISVQSCYDLSGKDAPSEHMLGNSPSTGVSVRKMESDVMDELMLKHRSAITYIGKVYGTGVDLPFWFKHFGKTDKGEVGAKDAYHIGVFGKTGSGKTVTASFMLLGYAKNKNNMSILVLDPQGQFYNDKDLLPEDVNLEDQVRKSGMEYEKLNILSDVYLPSDNYDLFGELLKNNGFIQEAFRPLYNQDKVEVATQAVVDYLVNRSEKQTSFNLSSISSPRDLLEEVFARFLKATPENKPSKYVTMIFGTKDTQKRLQNRITDLSSRLGSNPSVLRKWEHALSVFSKGEKKKSVDEIVEKIVNEEGNFLILNLKPNDENVMSENLPALFIKVIEEKIVHAGSKRYENGKSANCLIVMDEAHRFISRSSTDERVKQLTREITNSVRTTRKYGIGYMFITQTIESLDDEILSQMRIYAFGHGLTSGAESRKVGEIINNKASLNLYKSFIDPSSNNKFPFMFFGPISPLSFTGSPLFLEVYTKFEEYEQKNKESG